MLENIKQRGLNSSEVEESRRRHGKNIMSQKKRKSFLRQFFENLGDPVVKILIGALIINLIFMFRRANWVETLGIGVSIILATLISTMSEYGSQAAFDRLSRQSSNAKCRVLRDGAVCEIDISDVVVGDLVILSAGEQIAADGCLVLGSLRSDQSAMTGESREVKKRARKEGDREDFSPSSPYYCLRGCTVVSGGGTLLVRRVGDETFLGGISKEIQTETRESPLKLRLTKLARQISVLGYILAVLVALVYLFHTFVSDSAFDVEIIKYKVTNFSFLFNHLFHALTLGLTVIVVAVPEGLPMMIAVVLSSNIKRMVKDNVLVRKPVGIEAAGSMNILFTDKTGTLTEGKLSVGGIYLGDAAYYKSLSLLTASKRAYKEFLLSGFINTSSTQGKDSSGRLSALGGNSTDKAILSSLISRGERLPKFELVDRLEFDSERKYSASLAVCDREKRLFVKGAPEKILPEVSSYIDSHGETRPFVRGAAEELVAKLSNEGKRLLAIAVANGDGMKSCAIGIPSGRLTLIALITLEDKIRATAASSVIRLRRAGIGVVMITGDSQATARSIAEKCKIIDRHRYMVLTSGELALLSDAEVKERLPHLAVVARALPNDKSRLVRLAQECGMVVGMTGDGINDAPALKCADVGFSMGSGTQVAKDAGDIIIIDNDLFSITKAVLYGRNIFKSIRKFITLQLMMNFSAVGISMVGPFLGFEAPVTVVQMLWINIIMDTLGGLAFAGEAPLESCMEEKPKRRDEPILCGYMIYQILFGGGFTVALSIAFLKLPEITSCFRFASDNIYLLTAFFALFIFASVFNCFSARTDRLKLFANLGKNKAFIFIMAAVLGVQIIFVYLGGAVLRTTPLLARELAITFLLSLSVFPADVLRKIIWRLICGKKGY